jgi:hypothetical protein
MIAVPAGMQVMVATRPVDFRRGADGLVALRPRSRSAPLHLCFPFAFPSVLVEVSGPFNRDTLWADIMS